MGMAVFAVGIFLYLRLTVLHPPYPTVLPLRRPGLARGNASTNFVFDGLHEFLEIYKA